MAWWRQETLVGLFGRQWMKLRVRVSEGEGELSEVCTLHPPKSGKKWYHRGNREETTL